jgi:hypothetical protein
MYAPRGCVCGAERCVPRGCVGGTGAGAVWCVPRGGVRDCSVVAGRCVHSDCVDEAGRCDPWDCVGCAGMSVPNDCVGGAWLCVPRDCIGEDGRNSSTDCVGGALSWPGSASSFLLLFQPEPDKRQVHEIVLYYDLRPRKRSAWFLLFAALISSIKVSIILMTTARL